MRRAWVIELKPDGKQTQHGLFVFAQIPAADERVMFRADERKIQGFAVVEVEHFPVRMTAERQSQEPGTTIYVQALKEFPVE